MRFLTGKTVATTLLCSLKNISSIIAEDNTSCSNLEGIYRQSIQDLNEAVLSQKFGYGFNITIEDYVDKNFIKNLYYSKNDPKLFNVPTEVASIYVDEVHLLFDALNDNFLKNIITDTSDNSKKLVFSRDLIIRLCQKNKIPMLDSSSLPFPYLANLYIGALNIILKDSGKNVNDLSLMLSNINTSMNTILDSLYERTITEIDGESTIIYVLKSNPKIDNIQSSLDFIKTNINQFIKISDSILNEASKDVVKDSFEKASNVLANVLLNALNLSRMFENFTDLFDSFILLSLQKTSDKDLHSIFVNSYYELSLRAYYLAASKYLFSDFLLDKIYNPRITGFFGRFKNIIWPWAWSFRGNIPKNLSDVYFIDNKYVDYISLVKKTTVPVVIPVIIGKETPANPTIIVETPVTPTIIVGTSVTPSILVKTPVNSTIKTNVHTSNSTNNDNDENNETNKSGYTMGRIALYIVISALVLSITIPALYYAYMKYSKREALMVE